LPIGLLGGYGFCLFWRTLIHYGKVKIPGSVVKLALIIIGLIIIRKGYQNLLGVNPAAAFLLLAFIFKFLEAQRIRDGLLVIFLGYFCLPITFLFSQSILMTLYVLIALTVLTTSLVKIVKPVDHASGRLDIKQVSQMFLLAVPLMLVLFLLVPRIGPLWSVPLPSGHAKTGPSDSMSPGDIASLAQSDELAFRVEFEGSIPNTKTLYWRGLVFSDFDGRTWRMGNSHDQQRRSAIWGHKNSLLDSLSASSDLQNYQITVEPSHQPWLYALDYPVTSSSTVGLTTEYTLLAKVLIDKRSRYEMKSSPSWITDPILDPAIRNNNLKIPDSGNTRAKQFAINKRSKSTSDQQFVDEILNYYHQQPFYYSLKPPRLGEHTIDEFIFETRKGFCEHYAGSFVFLMRAAGIPARVVAGYQGGEKSSEGDYLLVHQFDAHAWAEVWLPNRGWLRVDPTAQVAPERIEYGIEEATAYENSFLSDSPFSLLRYRNNRWLSQLRLKLDAIEYDWNRWVLGYNANRQADFLKSYFGLVSSEQKTKVLIGSVILFLIVVTAIFTRKEDGKKLQKCDQLYLKFCRLMDKRGIARGAGEGAKDYSLRLIDQFPSEANRISTITNLYTYLNYGPDMKGQDRKRILKRLSHEITGMRLSSSMAKHG
jgi:transglutaminase-like putative cysteine protease